MMHVLRRAECGISAKLVLLVILGLAASPAFANTVIASGAGSLPGSAQDLTGAGVVTDIQGSLDLLNGQYVSMFAIDITNFQAFSAQTINVGAFGLPDTELFLFNSSGNAVYMNDDISGANTLSCLPSATGGNPCPFGQGGLGPTSNALYYLAIADSADLPMDATSTYLFMSGASTDLLGPNPGAGAIAGWDGGVYTSPDYDLNNYNIPLTGVGAVPEPAPWVLLLSALAGTWIFRSFARSIPVKVSGSN